MQNIMNLEWWAIFRSVAIEVCLNFSSVGRHSFKWLIMDRRHTTLFYALARDLQLDSL